MSKPGFDDLTDFYEAMIDWPKRLANEAPFYRYWFEKIGARSIVDVACGTGRHAAMFHEWDLTVEGADLSPAMIARARTNFGEDERLRWVVRGFDQPIERVPQPCSVDMSSATAGSSSSAENTVGQANRGTRQFTSIEALNRKNKKPFDAALCIGNSLALAPDTETVQRAIRQMFAAIRPGGLVIVHVLNLWQLPDGPCVWQKCKKANIVHQKSFSLEPTATAGGVLAMKSAPIANSPNNAVAVGSGLNENVKNENAGNDVLLLKGVHRSATRGYVEFLAASPADGKLLHQESVSFLGLEASQLERYARSAGANTIHFFGDYLEHPYERENRVDLLMVAEK